MMADKWTSVPDYDSGYDDYYTLYISPFKVWEPTTQGEVK